MKLILKIALLIIFVLFFNSCANLKNIADSLNNIAQIKFKLDKISDVRMAGISLAGKKSIKDFSLLDAPKLMSAYNSKSLNTEFIIDVIAQNPNNGSNGKKAIPATLKDLEWRLILDDVQTIAGGLESPIQLPSNGQNSTVKLRVNMNLVEFFGNKGYDGLVNLGLALAGTGATSKVVLDAKPTVTTSFGNINYPGRIKIIDKDFN